MNGLILFIGESFRLGGQGNRNRGTPESYKEQIKACNSHINFIEHSIQKFKLNSMSVFISTYNTQFDIELLLRYNKYLIGKTIYNDVIGLNNLFNKSLNEIKNIEKYDFISYIRIDLYLKQYFIDTFNPTLNTIVFPTICWHHDSICWLYNGDSKKVALPRVNDMTLFIPKKYYNYIQQINIGHNAWYDLVKNANMTYNDFDVMIDTYHDSDSFKDYNPLYYIVNRAENTKFSSEGHIFNKVTFGK